MRRDDDGGDPEAGDATVVRARTARGLDRLVNFTDATVAIAITVLVLPLVDIAADIHDEPLGQLLDDNRSAAIAFVVTFFVIARLWITHHSIFEVVADYDSGLVWWSFLWLFSIVTLPFAANVLSGAEYGDDIAVFALYVGTILAATFAIVGTEVHLLRRPELVRSDAPVLQPIAGYVMLGLVAVAFVVSITVPAIGLFSLFLLFLAGPVDAAVRRYRNRRTAT